MNKMDKMDKMPRSFLAAKCHNQASKTTPAFCPLQPAFRPGKNFAGRIGYVRQ